MNPLNQNEICPKPLAEYAPDDPCHRYALRRELLCSEVFEGNRAALERWDVFVAVTTAAFAGGVLTIIVLTIATTPRLAQETSQRELPQREVRVLPSREAFHMQAPAVGFDVHQAVFFDRVAER